MHGVVRGQTMMKFEMCTWELRRKVQLRTFHPKMQYEFINGQWRFGIGLHSFALIVNGAGDLNTHEGH